MTRDWEKIKSRRVKSDEARRGYEQARIAFNLGEQVRTLREKQGLSQSELAKKIGSTQPSVARLEAGGVTPSLDTLDRIASALGLSLAVRFEHAGARRRSRTARVSA